MKTVFYFDGLLTYANRVRGESPIQAVTRSIARRTRTIDLTISYSHAETLARGDGSDVYEARWYDAASETFKRAPVVLEAVRS